MRECPTFRSRHSVAEVLGEDNDPQLSINGWFHLSRRVKQRVRSALILPRVSPSNICRLAPGCYTVLGDEDAAQFLEDGDSYDFLVLRCPPAIDAMAIVHRDKDVFPFFNYKYIDIRNYAVVEREHTTVTEQL
ncbi:hypothetical protein KIN20_015392 [Parelaphostrongylus tenuis]|uniref:Uncharacterized protein n=1 Tax=Parelaphostrongylus tenuis TaxID=148309 RepID=A0AAD5N0K0_PARTN|nr:hypothetical protein KIN20_015392 [Parelaphostrongylus tenuis]